MKHAKILLLLGCVTLVSTGYFAGVYAQKQKSRFTQTWALSQTPYIRLGVWDKFDVSRSNDVTFVVTDSKGKQYKSEKSASEDGWISTTFPEDFSPNPEYSGYSNYSWKCIVEGKTVAIGQFKYSSTQVDTSAVYK